MEDPDAPNGTFTHWLTWNMNADVLAIDEGSKVANAQEGTNNANAIGYTGPCPPTGAHRYIFHLFALDAALDL